MSKQTEALKLALEALDKYFSSASFSEQEEAEDDLLEARKSIREALAEQPAQQEVDWEKLYRQEVKKKEALAAKYERDTGKKLTRIVPMAEQPAHQQAPASASVEPHCYMDEYGNVRGSYEYWMECEGGWFPVYTSLQPAPVAKPHEQQDYWQEEARRYAQNADFWRGKYESATAQQQEPVANGLPLVIAGAIFDFAGYLTTRDTVIEVGSTANASPVADLVKDWAALRGLSLADAAVLSWQEWLTDVRANDTPKERVDEMQKQRHDTTPPQPASKQAVGGTDGC